MKLNFQFKLSQERQAEWTQFWTRCRHTHAQQHLLFAEVERAKGRIPIYVTGEVDDQLVCIAIFSIRPIFFAKKCSLEAICLRGPAFDDIIHGREFLLQIISRFKALSVGRIRISPHWFYPEAQAVETALSELGFCPHCGAFNFRSSTSQVDLRRSDDQILASFSKYTRKKVLRASKLGVSIRPAQSSEEAGMFFQRLNKMLKSRGLTPITPKACKAIFQHIAVRGNLGVILNAFKDRVFLGGLLVIKGPYIAHATRLVVMPRESREHFTRCVTVTPLLFFHGMQWAKKNSCRWLDLEGSSEPLDTSDHRYRIHQYKQGFRPMLVERFAQCTYVCNPTTYAVYRGYDFCFRGFKFIRSLPYQIEIRLKACKAKKKASQEKQLVHP